MTGRRLIRIVEDDAAVSDSLIALLESWGFEVEAFADAESFLAVADPPQAFCVLMDVRLPGMDGLSALAALRAKGVATPVIMLSGHGDVQMAVRALRMGAQDFIEKPVDDAELVKRIEAAAPVTDAGYADRFADLTPRERQVMHEVVAGHPNKQIAFRLGLSPRTVEVHRARVMEKSGAASLSQLVRMALKAGIDPDEESGGDSASASAAQRFEG